MFAVWNAFTLLCVMFTAAGVNAGGGADEELLAPIVVVTISITVVVVEV